MPLARSGSFCVLTCHSRCGVQDVSSLARLVSFHILIYPSQCGVQDVSDPLSFDFFCILTSYLLSSAGSKFLFNVFVYFRCIKRSHFQKVNLSFLSTCSLRSHFFTSLQHSYYSTSYGHLTPMYCRYFFCFHLEFTNALSAATLHI